MGIHRLEAGHDLVVADTGRRRAVANLTNLVVRKPVSRTPVFQLDPQFDGFFEGFDQLLHRGAAARANVDLGARHRCDGIHA